MTISEVRTIASTTFRGTVADATSSTQSVRDSLLACEQADESNEDAARFAAMDDRCGASYRFGSDTAHRESRGDDRRDVPVAETQGSAEPQGGTSSTRPAPAEPAAERSSFGQ